MVAVTGYNYGQTRKILENQSYQGNEADHGNHGKKPGSHLSELRIHYGHALYKPDAQLLSEAWIIRRLSYWEMFSFVDTQLRGISVLNPDINRISFTAAMIRFPEIIIILSHAGAAGRL